jgi:hypothetical protein
MRTEAVVWRKYATSAQLRFVHEVILKMPAQNAADRILADDFGLANRPRPRSGLNRGRLAAAARTAGLEAIATAVSLTFSGKVSIGSIPFEIGQRDCDQGSSQ